MQEEWLTQQQVDNSVLKFDVSWGMNILLVLPKVFHWDNLLDAKYNDKQKKENTNINTEKKI